MHRTRLRQRGYNQALEVAREVSKALRVPVDYKCCRRTRNTVPQTSLQGKLRQKNLRGAFDVRGELPGHVAIVDDVVTTGATVRELARVMRWAGVERIEVWACARAGKSQ
jgi:predicted amidophosphoribosyltransferase